MLPMPLGVAWGQMALLRDGIAHPQSYPLHTNRLLLRMEHRFWIQGGRPPARGVGHQTLSLPVRDLRGLNAEGGIVTHKRPWLLSGQWLAGQA